MARKIDQRSSLQRGESAQIRDGQSLLSGQSADTGLRLSVREAKGEAASTRQAAAAQTAAATAAAEAVAAAESEVRATFELPGRDWGLGYGNLGAVQDQEVAFLLMGDGTISVVESGGGGYKLRTDYKTDGYFVGHLFGEGGLYAGKTSDVLFGFSDRKTVVLEAGNTNYSVRGDAADVFGTTGADSINGAAGDDIAHGAAGNDNIISGGGQDIAWGGAGNDAIAGNDGQDNLNGGVGNDTVDGGNGDDFITGGAGTDSMLGGDGDDIVLGGDGNDTVLGGAGADTLIAGFGADSVTGGDGADVFVFTEGDSGAGTTQIDTVTDFEIGVDKVDLTGFVGAIDFVAAFTDKAYQATLTDTETGTTIRIDNNGDGTADQEINVIVKGDGSLTVDDFIT